MDLKNIIKTKIQINQLILITLIVFSIAGTICFLFQFLSFQKTRSSLQQALSISEKERIKLKAELEQTKAKLLTQQDELYAQTSKEKEALNLELSELKLTLKQTEELLKQAKNEKQVSKDEVKGINRALVALRENMRLLEGKINNPNETKLALETRLQGLRELRTRIKNFKREAFLNKVRAQKEIDRIKLEKGNRGLVTKDGQLTLTAQRAIELEKIIIKAQPEENIEENK